VASPPPPRGLSIFGFPLQVSPFFLVIMLFLGMPRGAPEWTTEVIGTLAIWMIVVTVSILWHELGHAFAMRHYGYSPAIRLYGMGGLTMWGKGPPPSAKQRVVVSAAGPFAGFALGGVALLIWLLLGDTSDRWALDAIFFDLVWVNIGWGLLNLLPMLPWDGGHVLEGALDLVTGGKGRKATGVVTIVVALAAAGAAWVFLDRSIWALYLCGLSVLAGVRAIRGPSQEAESSAPTVTLTPAQALARAREALERVGTPDQLVAAILHGTRSEAWGTLATDLETRVAPACETDAQRATARELAARAVEAMRPSHDPSPVLEATVAIRREQWTEALDAAKEMDDMISKRRIEAYALSMLGQTAEALDRLGDDRVGGSMVDTALFHAARFDEAAELGAGLFERFHDAEDAYNTACSHARAGRALEGLGWLERALDAGYDDLDHLEADQDLAEVRALDGYGPLRARLDA
jgi:Zn-dependent protease